jgi:transcriptional regulator with XRE-family HTH domain
MPITLDAAKLRRLRDDRHWSQEHLAELAGVGVRTVQRIENGEKASNESLMALAAAFNIDASDLTENSNAKAENLVRQKAAKTIANMRLALGISVAGYFFVMLVFAGIGFGDGSHGYTMMWPAIWCTVAMAGHGLIVVICELVLRHQVAPVSERQF